VEDIKSDNIDQNLSGSKVPYPGSVLEAEIESTKGEKPTPISEIVLSTEADKPKSGESTVNLKSNPIESSINDPVKNKQVQPDAELKTNPIQVVKSESIETVKVITVPVKIETAAPTAATIATSGNTAQAAAGPTTTVNNSNVTNQSSLINSGLNEKEILKSAISTENLSSKVSEKIKESSSSILQSGTALLKEMSSTSKILGSSTIEKVASPEDLIMEAFLQTNLKEALADKAAASTKGPENVLSGAAGQLKTGLTGTGESAKAAVESAVLKTGKLADSNSVKQILTPDKTLERSVSKLTRELPESINNLSSSFSTFSPQSSNVTNVTNEGSKIDQSSTVNSMQTAGGKSKIQSETSQAANEQAGMNQNEFYLQAIYAALVSGKIRVKIEQL